MSNIIPKRLYQAAVRQPKAISHWRTRAILNSGESDAFQENMIDILGHDLKLDEIRAAYRKRYDWNTTYIMAPAFHAAILGVAGGIATLGHIYDDGFGRFLSMNISLLIGSISVMVAALRKHDAILERTHQYPDTAKTIRGYLKAKVPFKNIRKDIRGALRQRRRAAIEKQAREIFLADKVMPALRAIPDEKLAQDYPPGTTRESLAAVFMATDHTAKQRAALLAATLAGFSEKEIESARHAVGNRRERWQSIARRTIKVAGFVGGIYGANQYAAISAHPIANAILATEMAAAIIFLQYKKWDEDCYGDLFLCRNLTPKKINRAVLKQLFRKRNAEQAMENQKQTEVTLSMQRSREAETLVKALGAPQP